MGKRGPQPQPAELKKLRGNPGKRALPTPPVGAVATFPCPERLAHLAEEWARYSEILTRLGIMRETDGIGWEATVDCLALYIQARDEGDVNRMLAAGRELRTWLSHFGMTPSSRSSISVEAPKEEDEFSKFLRKTGTGK